MYSEQMWQNAKKKCRLNDADIALAKRLGLTSQSLIKTGYKRELTHPF